MTSPWRTSRQGGPELPDTGWGRLVIMEGGREGGVPPPTPSGFPSVRGADPPPPSFPAQPCRQVLELPVRVPVPVPAPDSSDGSPAETVAVLELARLLVAEC